MAKNVLLTLGANTASFQTNMQQAARSVKGIQDSLSLIKPTALIYLGQQALDVARQFYEFGKSVASTINNIEKQSKVLGMSTNEFQKWQYAAKMSDVEAESLAIGFKIFSRNIEDASQGTGDANKYLTAMGIVVKDATGNLKPMNDLMKDVMDKFASWEDGPRKIAISLSLFGRSGEQLIPLLNQGRKGFEEFSKEAEKLGIILDPGVIAAGTKAEDTFKKIDVQLKAIKLSLAPIALGFANFFKDIVDEAKSAMSELDKIGSWFSKRMEEARKSREEWQKQRGYPTSESSEKLGIKTPIPLTPEEFYNIGGPEIPIPKIKPPIVTSSEDLKTEQKALEDNAKAWGEYAQAELDALNTMQLDMVEKQKTKWKITDDALIKAEGELAQTLSDEMFPALDKVNNMVEQGEKYWIDVNKQIAISKSLIQDMDWESVASGVTTLSSATEQAINQNNILIQKQIESGKSWEKFWTSLSENISDTWSNNVSKMLTDSKNAGDYLKNIWKGIADSVVSAIIKMALQWLIFDNLTSKKGSEGQGINWGKVILSVVGGVAGIFGGGGGSEPVQLSGPTAEGGIFNTPQRRLIGEAGPEAVIPLKGGAVPVQFTGDKKEDKSSEQSKPTANIFYIYALDPLSFRDYIRKNPEAIVEAMVKDSRGAGGMRGMVKNVG